MGCAASQDGGGDYQNPSQREGSKAERPPGYLCAKTIMHLQRLIDTVSHTDKEDATESRIDAWLKTVADFVPDPLSPSTLPWFTPIRSSFNHEGEGESPQAPAFELSDASRTPMVDSYLFCAAVSTDGEEEEAWASLSQRQENP